MKPIKKLLRNTILLRGEYVYTMPEALEIMITERNIKNGYEEMG